MQVIEGRLSKYYNIFEEYEFGLCEATETRLMGVVAMRVMWTGKENPRNKLYQIIHLDYSEYGVDDYFEFECVPGAEDFSENKVAARYHWDSFVNVMGGRVVTIPCNIMMAFIDQAVPLAEDGRAREYDNEENAEFRRDTLIRFSLMRETLDARGALGSVPNPAELIGELAPAKLATCETINYFIMRLVDHDYTAARYLSTMSEAEMMDCELTHPGIQTLVRNNIKTSKDTDDVPSDGESFPYRCKATTLAENGYYYTSYVIYLNGDYRKKNAKITQISIGSMTKLSDYEAALQLQTTEYITVFDCRDRILSGFDGSQFEFLAKAEPQQVRNGWLYTAYNQNNDHVNSNSYWLNDDVYGYALLTIDGEFIMMSNKIGNINYMDQCAITSLYSPFMRLDGRYQLNEPVFHTICETYGVMFRDLIDHPDLY